MIDPLSPEQRLVGDPVADAAVQAALAAGGHSDPHLLLGDLRAFDPVPDWIQQWTAGAEPLPDWAELGLIRKGQQVFQKWDLDIAAALFCASLPWAYGDAPGVVVLARISELAETDHVARRIAETGRWLVALGAVGGLEPKADGYRKTRQVRLLHAVVRACLTPEWNVEELGLPVNQQDQFQTVLSFTTVVFDALDRVGVVLDERERRAYLHLWAVTAYLLGIEGAEQVRDLAKARAWTRTSSDWHRKSDAGHYLAAVLMREMELSMPWGLRKLPGAVVSRVIGVGEAKRLGVVPAGVWGPALKGLAGLDLVLARTIGVSVLRAPSRLVGRSLIRMWIDRTISEDPGPPFDLDPAKLEKWKIKTDPRRPTLTARGRARRARYLIRRTMIPPPVRYRSGPTSSPG